MNNFYTYIMASARRGTIYTGVTSNLVKRVYEHRNGLARGFTKTYCVHHLVWYEVHFSAESAISRERQIKKWNRLWKIQMIEEMNPEWKDLADSILE